MLIWKRLLVIYILISVCVPVSHLYLLWPQFTVLQITAAFSVPVEVPKRKVYFDWGFQMNYDLPYNVSNFYNVPIWPKHSRRSIDKSHYKKYVPDLDTHPGDLTAGEFYSAIEDLLESYGFHETCLLKSVCEIARHPFDFDRKNLMAEIITYALSPSLHKAFAPDEIHYKKAYEEAEFSGKAGKDCSRLYQMCPKEIFEIITKVLFDE